MRAERIHEETTHLRKRDVAGYVFCTALLGVTAYFGKEGPGDYAEATTTLQKVCSVAVIAYWIFAAIALIGLVLKQRWTVFAVAAWTLAMIIAGTTAPTAWGDAEVAWWMNAIVGLVIGGIGMLVGLIVKRLTASPGSPR